ncbi:MAG TPA: DUF309 domain-containing protein [Crinalium sp.]|jgi:hypothetical protein
MLEAVPAEFWDGVAQFNRGEFYDCHDTLEAIWMEAMEPQKTFYQGILQVAVGLYHLGNHNWRGAVTLLGEGTNRLRRYQPDYADIDVDQFLEAASNVLLTLQQAGPERVVEVAQQLRLVEIGQEEAIAPLRPMIHRLT